MNTVFHRYHTDSKRNELIAQYADRSGATVDDWVETVVDHFIARMTTWLVVDAVVTDVREGDLVMIEAGSGEVAGRGVLVTEAGARIAFRGPPPHPLEPYARVGDRGCVTLVRVNDENGTTDIEFCNA